MNRTIFVTAAAVLTFATVAAAEAPNPVVEGPIQGGLRGRPWQTSVEDVSRIDFVEEEYFLSGYARNLSPTAALSEAPYKTRIILRRPASPRRFSGTVIVEWLNVTGQADLEVVWGPDAMPLYARRGYAFVGVSAQRAGVCCGPASLQGWDPVRYGTLVHPGDDFSFDIFSQAVKALVDPESNRTTVADPDVIDPMAGLEVTHVIAHGASQSASRLTGYINGGYQADADLIRGFLITRGGGGFEDPADDEPLLSDLAIKMIHVNEENQTYDHPDDANYRMYHEAGAAHAPTVWWNHVWAAQSRDLAGTQLPDAVNMACSVNRATSQWAYNMATVHLDRWIRDPQGYNPPTAPRVNRNADGSIARDPDTGLATGGLRYPYVDAPVSTNDSTGCPLWGNYAPWTIDRILARYPGKSDYMNAVDASLLSLIGARLILFEDALVERERRDAFDVWNGQGTCYDTANPRGNEEGPLSGPLGELSFELMDAVGFGAGQDVHDASCNAIVRAGL